MPTADPEWLDRMYNNRALVPEHEEHFRRWAQWSQAARSTQPCKLDVSYGLAPAEKLDVFTTARFNAPVLFFIHGGYWRSLDKADHSFVAPPYTREGACVVVPNYALCPGTGAAPVTVATIVMQMVKALAWTWRNIARYGGDPQRITVAGHSAGGHLAAMMLACVWPAYERDLPEDLVKNALSLSGLYDLEPVRHTPFLKDSLRLTPQVAARASPALLPAPERAVLHTYAGAEESAEFLRHNQLIRQAWGERAVPVCEALPGLNHFSIVEALAEDTHALHADALGLLRG